MNKNVCHRLFTVDENSLAFQGSASVSCIWRSYLTISRNFTPNFGFLLTVFLCVCVGGGGGGGMALVQNISFQIPVILKRFFSISMAFSFGFVFSCKWDESVFYY